MLFIAIIIIVVGVVLFYGIGAKKTPSVPGIILFEGDDCDQCAKVETFIKNNKVEDRVAFTRLEVFHNDSNANLLADKSQTCGLSSEQIGVPFLWDGERCVIGYVDVIKFFQDKINLPKKP